ncbi:MAG: hypothetical protein ABFS21_00415 [Actinomycetota bacterium]
MRIGLDHTSEIGIRAGRLLLGEPDLELLGVLRRDTKDPDPRLRRIDDLVGLDAVVTDDPGSAVLEEALEQGTPAVLWAESTGPASPTAGAPVLVGANLVTGIGRSLVAREEEIAGDAAGVLFAWTEPGKPLRHGEAITFPDPVGARWGVRRSMTNSRLEVAAPVPDEWAGIIVRTSEEDVTRTVGIADLATHLEGIALAAGAVVAATGCIPAGRHEPAFCADDYLLAALRIGLDIASFTESS